MELTESGNFIPGFHSVRDSLAHGKARIKEIWIAEGKAPDRVREILDLADQRRIPVLTKDRSFLSRLMPNTSHQGIVALVEKFSYSHLDRLIDISPDQKTLLIALDHITDEGNLGAIIRTAAFFGVHGLIIPKDRSALVSANVLKRSSGAHVHLPIARVVNLGASLDLLKKKGCWIVGASGEGKESLYEFDWKRDVVLVLGNEQKGLSPSVRKRCDIEVRIPGSGRVESLNVAVASGVILSEIIRQR
ncbi:23S rRNA (guanosine-2'-O-)-methyltransferase RlmB [uncultured Desulfobacterium sp.]|uniref:23S rRNA (Guanosine-2'-O-)-methyltransferase RlmB n=1 Tax=uncultured Desulfobacterium sp. TaxID=201089 RepID=A0A445MWJ3_9BACT|nr:23S rRNA (guanosine-2'-O-)-methyltransferase RlmB [uncultured Desulfobacterium sp.]